MTTVMKAREQGMTGSFPRLWMVFSLRVTAKFLLAHWKLEDLVGGLNECLTNCCLVIL